MLRNKIKAMIITIAIAAAITGGIAIPAFLHPSEGNVPDTLEEQQERTCVETMTPSNTETTTPEKAETKDTSIGNTKATTDPGKETDATKEQSTDQEQEISDQNIDESLDQSLPKPDTEYISQSWIEEKIQEHRDEIEDEDLEDFRRILGKLDMNYVSEVLEGQHEGEWDDLIRQHMRSRLSGCEYERAKELFELYSHLM